MLIERSDPLRSPHIYPDIDFRSYFNNFQITQHGPLVSLGHLSQIRERKECKLCARVAACFRHVPADVDFERVPVLEPMARRIMDEISLHSGDHRPQISLFLRLVNRSIFSEGMEALNKKALDDVFTSLQLAVPDRPDSSTMCGRQVKSFVDLALCRRWLHACEKNHTGYCISKALSGGFEEVFESMNLVNVQCRSIVKAVSNS